MKAQYLQRNAYLWVIVVVLLAVSVAACQPASGSESSGQVRVVATTTIVGDVVRNVGGEQIALTVLLPPGTDPHAFDPSPRDLAVVQDADLVFINGAGLEEFLEAMLESAGGLEKVVDLSATVTLRQFDEMHADEEDEGQEDEHAHASFDPHVWTDPHSVIAWTKNIAQALAAADPENADAYVQRSQAYIDELTALDTWVLEQVATIPEEDRMIVTDHLAFGYFTARYGFTQVGAIMPGYSTLAEPSAQELAALEAAIRAQDVPAVFVGNTVNPDLAQRVAEDTGVALVFLYTGSLSDSDGDAPTYVDYIRYNVLAIVQGVKR